MTHSRAGRFLWSALLVSSGLWAQQTSGITARGRPEDYPVHVSAGGRIYAASLLSNDQVKHIFATNISGKYLVFEVACYPGSGTAMDIHADSFLAEGREKDIVRPADAMTVAARMQHKSTPPQLPSEIGNVQTEANIGYESGTDPYTGRRVHSTYEEVGVGVGNGPNPRASTVPPDWAQDMEVLQRQLEDRALPSGRFAHPVAGYLYFPVALLKKPGKDGYHLKYDGDDADKPVLIFPPKGH
jgi:hypothetical protein